MMIIDGQIVFCLDKKSAVINRIATGKIGFDLCGPGPSGSGVGSGAVLD